MTLSVYSIEQDKSFPISDGLAEVSEPVFDRSGKYLYLFGSTDAGPVLDWFAQSTTDNSPHAQHLPRRLAQRSAVAVGARRVTKRSRRPTSRPTPSGADGRETGSATQRSPPNQCESISKASNTAFSTCRFPPAICRTCRPVMRASCTTCAPSLDAARRRDRAGRRCGCTVSTWTSAQDEQHARNGA